MAWSMISAAERLYRFLMLVGKSDLWYKRALIYSLNVETYMDANGDGIGDFAGLTGRLDYLSSLGVTCLWFLPFFASPNRDNRYDVADYYAIAPELGTLGDFVEFLHEARERGFRVIIDLPVNHTSSDHRWFQEARKDPKSPYRNYYIWSEEKPAGAHKGMVFPGQQESTWTFDEEAQAYYFHRFYSHQPDLNIANPEVRDEIRKIMGFWLELGVSGFRIDAAPFLIEFKGELESESLRDDPHVFFRYMREFVSWRRGDAMLLAEANVAPENLPKYFGNGDKMHMLFNFFLNQRLFLALARQDATPIIDGLKQQPNIPPTTQWANFLRNHDELDLGRLSKEERHEVYEAFAPDENMRLYGRGIRRRLPPMLGDTRRLLLSYSLMLSLPGTPVLRYGEEIGMGDDLSLAGRSSVRTPMQWSDEANAGFSTASPEELVRPVIDSGEYSYERVNVTAQQRDPESFLNRLIRLINIWRGCPEIGWGTLEIVETNRSGVLAHRCQSRDGVVLLVHNLSEDESDVTLDLSAYERGHLMDLLGDKQYVPIERRSHKVELEAFGFRWFRIRRPHA